MRNYSYFLRKLPSIFSLLIFFLVLTTFNSAAMQDHDKMGEHPQSMTMPMSGEQQHVHQEPPPEIGLEPQLGATLNLDAMLVDEQGEHVRLGDLIDRPTLILPIYYSCPNVCNFMQAGVAGVIKELGRKPEEHYRILSISFDDTETPVDAVKASRTYTALAGHGFPDSAWHFLTGDGETTRKLFADAGYHFIRQEQDFLHPVVSFVVSADGKIVRYLHGTRPLSKDLTLALYEAESGRVGATIRKVVQFCFTYDPENNTYVLNLLRISATTILICLGAFLVFLLFAGKKKKKDKTS